MSQSTTQGITMNKKELATKLAETTSCVKSVKDATEIVEAFITIATNELASGGSIDLYGFGKFVTALQKGKTGKVPGTNKEYTTESKMVPRFKAAKTLKDAVAAGK